MAVAHPDASAYLLHQDELVFARTGASVGKSYLYRQQDGQLAFAGFLINVAPNTKVLNPKFLALFTQSAPYWDWVAKTCARSGQPGINGQEYAQLEVPLPDKQTQDNISEAVGDCDDLIERLEQLIAKKQAIKKGMMQNLLAGRMRLPGFGEPWHDLTVGEVANVTMGQSPHSSSYNFDGAGLPLIQGNTDLQKRRTIDRLWTTRPARLCSAGDVILTVRAPVGLVALASKVSSLGRGVCSLQSSEANNFLYHSLVYSEPRWSTVGQGSTFTAVDSRQVREFTLHWPADRGERSAISTVLDHADEEIDILRARLAKAKAIKQGMMQELLTGRTRLSVVEEVP